MVESRCGILCGGCGYREAVSCGGCVSVSKPFWGEACPVKTCCEEKSWRIAGSAAAFHAACWERRYYKMARGQV